MNIFATFPCPTKSARSLDDQRVVKMILESCQILSTVSHLSSSWNEHFTRPTHTGHPCVQWVLSGRDNFDWLLEHAMAMDTERQRRWGHDIPHRTLSSCLAGKIHRVSRKLPFGKTPHVNCARNSSIGVDYTHIKNTHLAYRLYLRDRWLLQPKPAVCTIKGLLEN